MRHSAHLAPDRAEDADTRIGHAILGANEAIPLPASLTPPEWRLSPSHSRMFAALAARKSVSHDGLLMCCAGPTDGERSNETLRVQVMRLRKRIQPHGYDVVSVWGQGYRLVRPEDRVADACVGILRSVGREMRAVSQ